MSETEVPDCPLCMETFEIDDINFFPCTCGYQVCRFCWHRIRTDENGLCPACRKAYSEDPAMYRPLSQDELQKIKKERKQKEVQQKQKTTDSRQHLANIRVIQKHLVFVVGLSNKMADPEVLKRQEYFGKYGKILKIVINPNTNYAGPQGPSASAYVTYSKEDEALHTINSVNNIQPPLKIRASLGTTKYCTHYLRNTICPKMDCMYLHDLGDMNASFTKEDMQAGKHQIFEKDLIDNYALSVQKTKQSHSQSHLSTNHHSVAEDAQAWSEGENDNTPMLPSNASWASVRDDKDKKPEPPKSKSRNNSMSIDYPSIEAASSRVSALTINSGGRERKDSNSVSSNDSKPSSKHSRRKLSVEKVEVSDTVLTTETMTTTTSTTTTSATTILQPPLKVEEDKHEPTLPSLPIQTASAPPGISKPIETPPQITKISQISSPSISESSASSITPSQPTTTTTVTSLPSLTYQDVTTTTVTTTTTSITSTSSATTSYPWPGSIGFGLSDLQIQANDDDLGFDPFKESKSGLEDLIATERKQAQVTSTTNSTDTKPVASFSWDSFWPANYPRPGAPSPSATNMPAPGMTAAANQSYSLFNPQGAIRAQSPSDPYDMPNKSPTATISTASSPQQDPTKAMSAYPFHFSTPPQQGAHPPPPPGHPLSQYMQQQQQQQMYGQRFPFQQPTIPPPGQAQPLHSFITPSTTSTGRPSATVNPSVKTSVDKNWQDGLRALLPNINISFASNWNNTPVTSALNNDPLSSPAISNTNNISGSLGQQVAATSQQQQTQPTAPTPNVANIASPPPGFSALLGSMENVNNKQPSSWPERDGQPQVQPTQVLQTQPQRIPPPPPGFRSPVATVNAEPFVTTLPATTSSKTVSSANTIVTTVASTYTISSAKAIPQQSQHHHNQQQQQNKHSQSFGSHEDPSILWSKVLSDKHVTREIETTNMLFPLPGETADQALSSASLPATPPQNSNQQSHLMSWNSVVSGNQYGKSPTSRDIMEPCTVNTKDTKDNTNSQKPQKPSPIFGNQQKHAVKKPTAHVKPLKCNPPNDGFTTVHNSSSARGNTQNLPAVDGNAHTGSRVSELDDFSADLPSNVNLNLTANIVSNSIVDYPPVAAQVSGNPSSKSKKKKKKGKEQPGLVSEIVVGFTTNAILDRPPPLEAAIVEEERPNKKKSKKKNKSNSVSPPTQRKSVDNTQEKSKDGQNFRILKSDTTTPHSPSQAVAGGSSTDAQQATSHEHELAVSRLTESTEKLLKNVLFETEAIKLNTEQISKDLKSALEKCKESSLSLSDLEKINLLLTPGKITNSDLDDPDLVDTTDLERQVESARREAKLLEARLNDVIRKNMASELETLKRNTKPS